MKVTHIYSIFLEEKRLLKGGLDKPGHDFIVHRFIASLNKYLYPELIYQEDE